MSPVSDSPPPPPPSPLPLPLPPPLPCHFVFILSYSILVPFCLYSLPPPPPPPNHDIIQGISSCLGHSSISSFVMFAMGPPLFVCHTCVLGNTPPRPAFCAARHSGCSPLATWGTVRCCHLGCTTIETAFSTALAFLTLGGLPCGAWYTSGAVSFLQSCPSAPLLITSS